MFFVCLFLRGVAVVIFILLVGGDHARIQKFCQRGFNFDNVFCWGLFLSLSRGVKYHY